MISAAEQPAPPIKQPDNLFIKAAFILLCISAIGVIIYDAIKDNKALISCESKIEALSSKQIQNDELEGISHEQ